MSDPIRDYLQTQGLRLPADAVRVAQAAAEAVIQHGQAAVEGALLWQPAAVQCLERNEGNEALLKQIFMAFDAAYERCPVAGAAVYGLHQGVLLRLAQQGEAPAAQLAADGSQDPYHLAVRSAVSGWLNWAENLAEWLQRGDLQGDHHDHSQAALPVCLSDGRVYGVVYLAHHQPITAEMLADWLGLTLALQPVLAQLLPPPEAVPQN